MWMGSVHGKIVGAGLTPCSTGCFLCFNIYPVFCTYMCVCMHVSMQEPTLLDIIPWTWIHWHLLETCLSFDKFKVSWRTHCIEFQAKAPVYHATYISFLSLMFKWNKMNIISYLKSMVCQNPIFTPVCPSCETIIYVSVQPICWKVLCTFICFQIIPAELAKCLHV